LGTEEKENPTSIEHFFVDNREGIQEENEGFDEIIQAKRHDFSRRK
jgi:hypothetical protein